MNNNFILGIIAVSQEIALFFSSLFHNNLFVGFVGGVFITIIISGLIITKDPKRIPLILRHSSSECFEKIANRHENGTYNIAYSHFLKIYTRVRILSTVAVISFFLMIITIILTFKNK